MQAWSDFNIVIPPGPGPEVAALCPQCSHTRKKKTARCLSVNIEKFCWVCAHCDWRGSLKDGDVRGRKIYTRPVWVDSPVSGVVANWFLVRGIRPETVAAEGIREVTAYMPQLEDETACIAFPYFKGGVVANVKYRALQEKAFRQIAGAEKILYRQDKIQKDLVVIVEGEVDCLSVVQAGFSSSVSVPDGAPAPTSKNYTAKFTYLDQDPDPFDGVEKIVLAVDSDEPGHVLQQELARRLGSDRCYLATWPEGCKDANDVLKTFGDKTLAMCLAAAKPFPVRDAVTIHDMETSVTHRYFHGVKAGLSTGWKAVDNFYTVEPGQLTIVTGIPGHGKSEFLDALALNLMETEGWRFAVCSPENAPVEQHIEKLLEKALGSPFRVGPSNRMTPTELKQGLDWLDKFVTFLMPEDALTIDDLIGRATTLVRHLGIRGLILDPFNEFDHTRPRGESETEYIGRTLSTVKRWARKYQVHVWIVAHPQKLYRREDGTYPVPTPWDINGSANWRNKADNCLTVWRDEKEPDEPVQIHIQKVRFKHIGRVGLGQLKWDRATGRYSDFVSV